MKLLNVALICGHLLKKKCDLYTECKPNGPKWMDFEFCTHKNRVIHATSDALLRGLGLHYHGYQRLMAEKMRWPDNNCGDYSYIGCYVDDRWRDLNYGPK